MAQWVPEGSEPFDSPVQANRPINNPGNLRKPGSSSNFMAFPTIEAGRVALEQDLIAKGKRGPTTITQFLNTYSPNSENKTATLIDNMSKRLGIGPNDKIDLSDPATRAKMADAVQVQEGYKPIPLPVASSSNAQANARLLRQGSTGLNSGTLPKSTPTTPEEVSKAKVASNQDFLGAAGTFLNNTGRAVTSGLTDYPAAVVEMGVNKLTGHGGDKNTFERNLADVRASNAADNKSHPIAALAGEVTGDLAQGVITGGGSLPSVGKAIPQVGKIGQIVIGAGSSGVQKWTESPTTTLSDVGKSALIGGGIVTGAQTLNKGVQLGQKFILNRETKAINKAGKELKDTANAEIAATRAEQKAADEAAQQKWLKDTPESGPALPQPQPTLDQPIPGKFGSSPAPQVEKFVPVTPDQLSKDLQETGKLEPWQALKDAGIKTGKEVLTAIPEAAAGYLGGEWASQYLPEAYKVDPDTGGVIGAMSAVGGMKAKAAVQALHHMALYHPSWLPSTINTFGQTIGHLAGGSPEATKPNATYSMPPAAPDERTLLRQTIDEDIAGEKIRKANSYVPEGSEPVTPPTQTWEPPGAEPYTPDTPIHTVGIRG